MSKNGRLPDKDLIHVGDGYYLKRSAGLAWLQVIAAAKIQAKLTVKLVSAYRLLAIQVKIFLERYVAQAAGGGYYGDVKVYNGKRYVRRQGTASAATPGTSKHGDGNSVDVTNIFFAFGAKPTPLSAWLVANAPKFGWVNPGWARTKNFWEPWHFEYVGKTAKYAKKVVTRKAWLRETPNGKLVRTVPKGTRFAAVRGSRVKAGRHYWILTRSGLWIAVSKTKGRK